MKKFHDYTWSFIPQLKDGATNNCKVCQWCVELACRGIDILPRPIDSPRDPIFINGDEEIYKYLIKDPQPMRFKSGKELMKMGFLILLMDSKDMLQNFGILSLKKEA